MTDKKMADLQASQENTHIPGNYTTHLSELELLLLDQLHLIGQPWPFAKLTERLRAEGFSRSEIIQILNDLVARGVVQYRRFTHRNVVPWPRVELQVVLVEVQA